jgi:hypothetical protein
MGVFQSNVFQNNVFQGPHGAVSESGVKSMFAFWMGGAGTIVAQSGPRSMLAFWAGGAGSPQEVVTPPTDTIPPGGGLPLGGNDKRWQSYRDHFLNRGCKKKLTKKQKSLLEALDEALVELKERVAETSFEDSFAYEEELHQRHLRVSMELAEQCMVHEFQAAKIKRQIEILNAAIEELDDEEAILLALH